MKKNRFSFGVKGARMSSCCASCAKGGGTCGGSRLGEPILKVGAFPSGPGTTTTQPDPIKPMEHEPLIPCTTIGLIYGAGGAVTGGIAGAIVGALVAPPGARGKGAAIGAGVTGGLIGLASGLLAGFACKSVTAERYVPQA